MSKAREICKAIFLSLLIPSAAVAAEASKTVIDDPTYTHAQHLVEVEPGRRLNLYCLGEGSSTVVFESGLTDETVVWARVQPAIADHTRACSYDRAGLGYSDPGRRPADAVNNVDDLHRLLTAASIKPPYILIGGSLGGMYVRLYADLYPQEVVGMVLVDPSHEDWEERAWKLDMQQQTREQYFSWDKQEFQDLRDCVKAAAAGFVEGSESYKKCIPPADPLLSDAINAAYLKTHLSLGYQQAQMTEQESYQHASSDEVRAAQRWYGDMPLIVLAAGVRAGPRKGETQSHRDAINRVYVSLYDQLAALSTRGVNRVVPGATHDVQNTQPQAVIDAILEVLKEAAEPKEQNPPEQLH